MIRLSVNVVFSNDLWSTDYQRGDVESVVLFRYSGLDAWSMSVMDFINELRFNDVEIQDVLFLGLNLSAAMTNLDLLPVFLSVVYPAVGINGYINTGSSAH